MRNPFIAGNWKMNTNLSEAVELANKMKPHLLQISNVEKVICPPFVSLAAVREIIKDTSIKLGAQNVYYIEKGAYTGEISPLMLRDVCEYVIIGHSERRQYFNETGDMINKKIKTVLKFDLKPILCVGEKLDENESGKTNTIISNQLKTALDSIENAEGLVIAYEPVWAIGTGKAANGAQANETIGFIRHTLMEINNKDFAQKIRILYGGSVTPENTREFIEQPEIDGALVGGASLKAEQFISIVRSTSQIKKY
jgi:triosephosphate isomerase (TIM)